MENGFLSDFLGAAPPAAHAHTPAAPGPGATPAPTPELTQSLSMVHHMSALAAANPWVTAAAPHHRGFPPSFHPPPATPPLSGAPSTPLYPPMFSHPSASPHPLLASVEARRALEVQRSAVESQRMAEVQRVLEQGRKDSSASAGLFHSSLARDALFSHGLPPLDRGGIFPAQTNSILDPMPNPNITRSSARSSDLPEMRRPPTGSAPAPFHPQILPPTSHYHDTALPSPKPNLNKSLIPQKSKEDLIISSVKSTFLDTSTWSSPLSTSSSRSLPSSTTTTSSLTAAHLSVYRPQQDDYHDTEEVLVDDFDGQCCRTYPYNHSRIQKWQKERNEKRKLAEAAKAATSSSKTIKGEPEKKQVQNKTVPKKNEPLPLATTSASIPVGIAIGRQRQQQQPDGGLDKRSHEKYQPLTASSGATRSAHGLGSLTPSNNTTPNPHWPSSFWPPGPGSHLSHPPPPGSSFPHPSLPYWLPGGMPPSGPIPMGYQLAKDPLTGQILLIPTEGAQHPPPPPAPPSSGLWPPPPSPSPHFDPLGHHPLGLPSPGSREAHSYHQQMYLHHQQQQHNLYMQSLRTSSSSTFPFGPTKGPSRRLEPETITVSDDDDDKEVPAEPKVDTKPSEEATAPKPEDTAPKPEGGKDPDLCKDIKSESPIMASPKDLSNQSQNEEKDKAHIDSSIVTVKQEVIEAEKETEAAVDIKVEQSDEFTDQNCAEALVSLAETPTVIEDDDKSDHEGFLILLRAIEQRIVVSSSSTASTTTSTTTSTTSNFDYLFAAVQEDSMRLGVYKKYLDTSSLDINLLCQITAEDYAAQLNFVDPEVLLRQQFRHLRQYKTKESEISSRRFIDDRIKRYSKEAASEKQDIEENYWGIKSLAKVIKEIKNMEIMSQLEVDLRAQLVQLQSLYRERQRYITRMKFTPKKHKKTLAESRGSASKRGPGRPKKRKLKSSKTKMGRPRKKVVPTSHILPPPTVTKPLVTSHKSESEDEDLSPPILEPCASFLSKQPSASTGSDSTMTHPKAISSSSMKGTMTNNSLLKPPKLTASLSPPYHTNTQTASSVTSSYNRVTNLSTINAKFMKGKASPFANLMKLATVGSGAGDSQVLSKSKLEDVTEEDEDDLSESGEESNVSGGKSPGPASSSPAPSSDKKPLKKETNDSSEEASSSHSSKKRKSEKPKKQSGITETIVPKKPRNLFMMNCLSLQQELKSGMRNAEDEYDFNDDDDEILDPSAMASVSRPGRMFTEYRDPSQASSLPPTLVKSKPEPHKETKKVTSPKQSTSEDQQQTSSKVSRNEKSKQPKLQAKTKDILDATLTKEKIKNNLQILVLQDGRFWQANVSVTQLDDIYSITMKTSRSNKGNSFIPAEELFRDSIVEVSPRGPKDLPVGTRVCVFWSQLYHNCLFPGTIEQIDCPPKENMVQVALDDGDCRQVDISSVRLLPPNYNHVSYDPDPISSLRKRRVSSDSVDSGGGDRQQLLHRQSKQHQEVSPPGPSDPSQGKKKSSKLEKPLKKHKHKHKHHHCRHKHKKHNKQTTRSDPYLDEGDHLRIKLDGSFNNTTTYSIRSPMYQTRSEESTIEEEDGEEEETSDSDDETTDEDMQRPSQRNLGSKKSGINPVTGRPLWTWMEGDDGYRRPGSKGKAKKLFHRSIQRGDEILNVGDCAVFLSTARVDRPYIGRVELLWETWNGNMMVKVKWFYHPEEIETTSKKFDLKIAGGLFESPHTDENDVQTISHRCRVVQLKEYSKKLMMITDPAKRKKMSNSGEIYYLAGSYDPTIMSVNFQPGVVIHQ